jgi:hypothetical protein
VIVGHHGGEATLLQAAVVAAGSLSVALGVFRVELYRLGRLVRRRPERRSIESRAEGAATNEGGKG